MSDPQMPIWQRPRPQVAFWRMARAGTLLALAASLVNGVWSTFAWDAWMTGHRIEADTFLSLGFGLSAMVIFPLAHLILLAVVLPAITQVNPDLPQSKGWAWAMVLVPTAIVARIWYDAEPFFWVFTLPAVAASLMATGAWVLLIRAGWADPAHRR